MRRLVIYSSFSQSESWQAGSQLRLRGYTQGLNEIIPDYVYYGYSHPHDWNALLFIPCTIHRRWHKIMALHNVLFCSKPFRLLAIVLKVLIERFSHVKEIDQLGANILFYSHQDSFLAMYLHLTRKIPFVYDIHGIFAVQKEYTINYNWWRKMWFQIYLHHEKVVFEQAPFLNVVSQEMAEYINNHYVVSGKILVAPDGIPANLDVYDSIMPTDLSDYAMDKKVILFAGSCKPIGGVNDLVSVFTRSSEIQEKSVLLLVVTDTRFLEGINLNQNIKVIPPMLHSELIGWMKAADVIVCPDNEDNKYNKICPHIKFYDALAIGTPVVATDLSVNRNVVGDMNYPIFYFSKQGKTLEQALLEAIESKRQLIDNDISQLTYSYQMEQYWTKNKELLLNR